MIFETACRAMVLGEEPRYSAGWSSAPTPTMHAWPLDSRGTECTVPMPPGLVRDTVVPW